jgi:hypothetical protein
MWNSTPISQPIPPSINILIHIRNLINEKHCASTQWQSTEYPLEKKSSKLPNYTFKKIAVKLQKYSLTI